jgi:hypothetical protein
MSCRFLTVALILMVTIMNSDQDPAVLQRAPFQGKELSVGKRFDRNGNSTFHVITNDKCSATYIEKIYDEDHRLTRLQKRTPGARSETTFDPITGAVLRIFESGALNDGNVLAKEVVYGDHGYSNEAIIVVAPNGDVVRRVEREYCRERTTYQGQTEYSEDGSPSTSVNHHLDQITGRLVRREQIQWLREGQRLVSECFQFDAEGSLEQYSKVLYYASAGPFVEETQVYDGQTQALIRREISAFDLAGKRTRMDVLTYDDFGDISERASHFFDKEGREIEPLEPAV